MSFVKELLKRRVPQILGIYLATSWAIIEFLDWLIEQFSVSPYLPTFVLLIFASMIPTVLLIAYFHGKPGRDTWTKTEKIGIPVNVVAAAFLLFFVFKGKELGATTSVISLEDEEGQTIERIVPKTEFRKKLMLYFPANETGDTSLNWLSYGIADMLSTDLIQDYYLEVRSLHVGGSFVRVKEAGYTDLTGLPLMLEKEIADDRHLDYFLTGSFSMVDEKLSLETKLYNTGNGKLIAQNTFFEQDVFDLVDQLSVQLKKDLEIPEYHIEQTTDLPVAEIATRSLEAYKWYILGAGEAFFHQDFNKAIQQIRKAVSIDSTFSLAQFALYQMYLFSNQSTKGGGRYSDP